MLKPDPALRGAFVKIDLDLEEWDEILGFLKANYLSIVVKIEEIKQRLPLLKERFEQESLTSWLKDLETARISLDGYLDYIEADLDEERRLHKPHHIGKR